MKSILDNVKTTSTRLQATRPRWLRRGGPVSALFAFALLAESAHALFHLWDFNEIYSNEDGSVQFIEFFTGFANQESLSTQLLSVTDSFGTRTFTFPTNLPSGTADKTFVVATANLAFLPGGVRPDYVLTNAGPFLIGNSGSITLVGAETVTFTNLPRDGVRSLVRSGAALSVVATNSPKNYFDAFNSIVPVKFSSIARSGTNLLLSFATATGTNGTAGPNYTILRLDDLNATNSSTLTNVTGDGTSKTVTAPITGPQGFFRLQVP